MKRLITLLLAFTMLFVIVGCSDTDTISSGGTNESNQHTVSEKSDNKTETKVENFVEKEPEKETQKESITVTVPKQPETTGNLVWIPTNGGVKYHKKSSCSNMKNPIQVTKETAEAKGFDPCGRCY